MTMTTNRLAALVAVASLAVAGPALAGSDPITTLRPAPAAAPAAPAPVAPAPTPAAPAPVAAPPAPVAPAPPRPVTFEVIDRGDTVEVIAHNLKAARTAIFPVRSRLEVPIVGAPVVKRALPTDPTVKVIELDGDETMRSLSVKLGFERADVKTLARFAQAIQVGDDLHLLVPRKVPAEGQAAKVPEPTLTPELAATVARAEPTTVGQIGPRPDPNARKLETKPAETSGKPETKSDAKPEGKPDGKPDGKSEARPEDKPEGKSDGKQEGKSEPRPEGKSEARIDGKDAASVVANDASPAKDAHTAAATIKSDGKFDGKLLKPQLASDPSDAWSKIAMYAALGLGATGFGIWWMRKRKGQFVAPASIEIIAQRSLGGKARIVWLSAGPREMIVSVTSQQVRMLGQWRKNDAGASLPAAQTHSDPRSVSVRRASAS
ncbi:MAG TPA: flagellar biosynthetic protein FliO, partial [Kofleriaceae bacterium]|nr:flagellar biosynthetic protein FliO [Kofleriaceae bacterium]